MNLYELKNKTLADDNFLKQMSYKLNDSDERASFFNWVSKLGNHWQENPTPYSIIRKMVSKTSLQNKKILVLFNIEFLHVLVDEQKVNSSDIVFISDNKIEQLCAIKIFKVESYNLDDFSVPALKKIITGIEMKFDIVFSNPPYNNGNQTGVDLKIMKEILPISKEVIFIHPSTWLYDYLQKDKTSNEIKQFVNNKMKSIQILDSKCFGINLPNNVCITHYSEEYKGVISVQDQNNNNFSVDTIFDFTILGENYYVCKPFFDLFSNSNEKNGSLFDHTIDVNGIPSGNFEHNGEWYVQLADAIGNDNKPDFYTFLLQNPANNLGLRKTGIDNSGNPVFSKRGKKNQESAIKNSFKFSTEAQAINFVNFLKTDFARFCIVLSKKNLHIDSGELKYVPWLDFTEEWDDEKLFKKFNISQEIQDCIKEFLPDYYGIRK